MKLLSASQLREWDEYTIKNEPVSSIELMERAARSCVKWINEQQWSGQPFMLFCGKGNNGGDGLAIARMLFNLGNEVTVYILEFGHIGTEDFQANLVRLHQFPQVAIHFIQEKAHFPAIDKNAIVIDTLFGSGLNRSLHDISEKLAEHINASGAVVISIDIPSGMLVDQSSVGFTRIKAQHTLSFQIMKPAFMVAENAAYTGKVHILDIGLHPEYYKNVKSSFRLIDKKLFENIYRPRDPFAHKGNFGHALLVAGSEGKMGAAILAAKACLRSGVGLLTCKVPDEENRIIEAIVPEAMTSRPGDDISRYTAIGVGPGLGISDESNSLLKTIFETAKGKLVIDADGLNIISRNQALLSSLPAGSILTPHLKEFDRMFGPAKNEFERIATAIKKSKELNLVIVLKGHHSFIAIPGSGEIDGYFNSSGNAGMATAGSGDVLTGIITGLLAQGYSPENAAIFGVCLHGVAGDLAAARLSQESMIASDIIAEIGNVFKTLPLNPYLCRP
jgi:ADP-dependent NAD(P)H-hydrate dehydratase / NAD(P)H-hydrate epimerase